jgi:hypothetical protein
VILLTAFGKTHSAEIVEVQGALGAQKICEADHGVAHDAYEREVK